MTQLKKFEALWLKDAKTLLEGKTIRVVRFMTHEEMKDYGWKTRPLILQLDDQNIIYPTSDEHASEGGSLLTNLVKLPVIPSQL